MSERKPLEKRMYTADEVEAIAKERVNEYRRYSKGLKNPARQELLIVLDNLINAGADLDMLYSGYEGFRRRSITKNLIKKRWTELNKKKNY